MQHGFEPCRDAVLEIVEPVNDFLLGHGEMDSEDHNVTHNLSTNSQERCAVSRVDLERESENQHEKSMVLSSFDFITATSTSDRECV